MDHGPLPPDYSSSEPDPQANGPVEVPPSVAEVAAQRGLGQLVDVRLDRRGKRRKFLTGCGTAIAAQISVWGLMALNETLPAFSLLSSIAEPAAVICFLTVIWATFRAIRGLVIARRTYHLYEDGIVRTVRWRSQALPWSEVTRLTVARRPGLLKAGEVVGYAAHTETGLPLVIPLVLDRDDRDTFMDRVIDRMRALGRPVEGDTPRKSFLPTASTSDTGRPDTQRHGAPPYLSVIEAQRLTWSSEGTQAIQYGSLWILGGLLVTLVTYMSAAQSPYGGIYIVAWGPALYGLYRILAGTVLIRRSKR